MARVDANPVDAEQVAGEAERLTTWRDQLNALKRRVRIYETTLAAIQAAESMTMKKATRFLEHQVGRDIARLTGGRYRRVSIDDQTLDIQVWAPERGDWVQASQLSKGTVDQVFLAARIGLVRLVTQNRRPPLILDDPFVTFDDTRAARAALLLRELSSDFQVIYLACSNRYDGLADSVVELPGPTEAESAAAAPAGSPGKKAAADSAPTPAVDSARTPAADTTEVPAADTTDQPEPAPWRVAGEAEQASAGAKIVAFPGPVVETDESNAETPADDEKSPAAENVVDDIEDDEDGPIQLQAEIPTDEEITPDADPDASANGVGVQPEPRSVTSPPADREQPEH